MTEAAEAVKADVEAIKTSLSLLRPNPDDILVLTVDPDIDEQVRLYLGDALASISGRQVIMIDHPQTISSVSVEELRELVTTLEADA